MRYLNRGENLLQEELQEIVDGLQFSKHSLIKIEERHKGLNVKESILNTICAYYNTDGSCNIAISEWEYFVIDPQSKIVITFKEKSLDSHNIFYKQKLAQQGIGRIPYKRGN